MHLETSAVLVTRDTCTCDTSAILVTRDTTSEARTRSEGGVKRVMLVPSHEPLLHVATVPV